MNISLKGKLAVVTGASRGIGRGVALGLARAGADLALLGRSQADLEALVREISASGGTALGLPCDLTKRDQLERVFEGLGRVDVLVNNAGMNIPEPFAQVSEDHFDAIFDLNLKAAFFATQCAVRRMLEAGTGGVIVNIGSQMGHVGAPNRTVYCASKHALEGFTKALAVELGPHGIRVVSIAPTFVETPLTRPMLEDENFRRNVISSIPLGHLGEVEDVANAVVFAASEAGRMMTGSSLILDGGWIAR